MGEAYDRVEWGCVEKIMLKICFHTHWVEIMIRCVQFVTYAVKINGKPQGNITPIRGLCQRDLLPPYLFLLYFKGLLALLHRSAEQGALKGAATCARDPNIFHLFFANDSLIFC